MNPMLKVAYDYGCQKCLADLGLTKTAAPKWLKMLRADPGLADAAALSAGIGHYPGAMRRGFSGEAAADVADSVQHALSLEGRPVGDIRRELSRTGLQRYTGNLSDSTPWSARNSISDQLLLGPDHPEFNLNKLQKFKASPEGAHHLHMKNLEDQIRGLRQAAQAQTDQVLRGHSLLGPE